jgi:hypothetical protein
MRNRKPITALLIVCVVAALALPAAASAMYQFGDSPTVALRDGATPSPSTVSEPAPSVTVNHTSTTLPVVLASVALGIALTGTAYVALRLRSIPRT